MMNRLPSPESTRREAWKAKSRQLKGGLPFLLLDVSVVGMHGGHSAVGWSCLIPHENQTAV